jgi:hypothetical protein
MIESQAEQDEMTRFRTPIISINFSLFLAALLFQEQKIREEIKELTISPQNQRF